MCFGELLNELNIKCKVCTSYLKNETRSYFNDYFFDMTMYSMTM